MAETRDSKLEARHAWVWYKLNHSLAFQARMLRKREGWTQKHLAAVMGVSERTVRNYEDPNYEGRTILGMVRIACAFDVALSARFVKWSEFFAYFGLPTAIPAAYQADYATTTA